MHEIEKVTFDLRAAMKIPPESLTFRQSVFLALELLKAASPVLARHFDSVPNVIVAFEVALEEYSPDTIRKGAIHLLRSMKSETRDLIPDAMRLAACCDEIKEMEREDRILAEARKRLEEYEEKLSSERAADDAREAAMTPEDKADRKRRIDEIKRKIGIIGT